MKFNLAGLIGRKSITGNGCNSSNNGINIDTFGNKFHKNLFMDEFEFQSSEEDSAEDGYINDEEDDALTK